MPSYLSPGVYVEEIPSAVQAIAGVGTSTAGFIGIVPDVVVVPQGPVARIQDEKVGDGNGEKEFLLDTYPVQTTPGSFDVKVDGQSVTTAKLMNVFTQQVAKVVFASPPDDKTPITVSYETFATPIQGENIGVGTVDAAGQGKTEFVLATYPVLTKEDTFTIRLTQEDGTQVEDEELTWNLVDDHQRRLSKVIFTKAPPKDVRITGDYYGLSANQVIYKEKVGVGNGSKQTFAMANYPVLVGENGQPGGLYEVRVGDYAKATPASNVRLEFDDEKQVAQLVFTTAPNVKQEIWADYMVQPTFRPVAAGEVKLCTSFSDFRRSFGDFSTDVGQRNLAHAVYGFFHNGGTRCYVARITQDTELDKVLEKFAAIDEIALVAAPGLTDDAVRDKIVAHCGVTTQDRFAIFDSKESIDGDLVQDTIAPPSRSDYAAFYFPWIQVFDPATKRMNPEGDGRIYVPPSGHMAGIYARVDTNRGVHKAPANEPVMGALGLKYQISKAQQDGLNPQGINCIRELNGNIRVWGARTVGGDGNGEWRYINVRRTFLYLRESIDEGTQWAVFEPNDQNLWAKITRNITAFLTNVWRTGALFGSTPAEAFYVKCDAETNPPELRELGQVVTEIGVAVVRPAEFVIFRISQWQPQKA
ncbi:MAG: phage tail sheath subtilisin-like domain-containing protein [Caldilineaceae bacterium]